MGACVVSTLQAQLLADRQAAYLRLKGGFPVPMAGMAYWLAVAAASQFLAPPTQLLFAFVASGAIFPLALFFAALFRNPFMKDRAAATSVLLPAFISMLLFWPMIVVAVAAGQPDLALVILAIGMSIHWPVIGWSYGRTWLFSAHSILRALVVMGLWLALPEQRFFVIPLSVAVIYAMTVIAILIDTRALTGGAMAKEQQA